MNTSIRFIMVSTILFAFSCTGGAQESKPAGALQSPRPISYNNLKAALETPGSNVLLVDVRTKAEFDQGHIPGSVLIPYDVIETELKEADKSRPIVVYCRSGNRSSIAARALVRMGYTDVADFGAVSKWRGTLQR
jgi:rhodanese-related sulfurtransferase